MCRNDLLETAARIGPTPVPADRLIDRRGMRVTRRRFCEVTIGTMAVLAFGTACHANQQGSGARITARPVRGVKTAGPQTRTLGLGAARDAVLQLPSKAGEGPMPLLVLLHGAGGSGAGILKRLGSFADEAGIAVLAPDSRTSTWDAIRAGFGPDVTFLNRALERTFQAVTSIPTASSSAASRMAPATRSHSAAERRSLPPCPGLLAGFTSVRLPRVNLASSSRTAPRTRSSPSTVAADHRAAPAEERIRGDLSRFQGDTRSRPICPRGDALVAPALIAGPSIQQEVCAWLSNRSPKAIQPFTPYLSVRDADAVLKFAQAASLRR